MFTIKAKYEQKIQFKLEVHTLSYRTKEKRRVICSHLDEALQRGNNQQG